MRAGINAVFLEPGMGGLETYVLRLTPALLAADPSLRLTIVCNSAGGELLRAQPWAGEVSFVTPAATRRGLRAVYELTALGLLAGRSFDLLHSPAMTAPLATRAANVVVLPDTTWITVPDLNRGQAGTVRLWRAVVPRVARRADRVIAISAAAAADVERHLRVPAERIDVIPLGYRSPDRVEATPERALREQLGLGSGPIVLNVGAKKEHKNQLRLIQALASIREAVPDASLVLAGASTPYEAKLRAEASRHGLQEVVAMPDYVSDADLAGLYGAASVFAFPSLNEGFGLPILEAMGRDLPVVTSRTSSLPEVAGDAAVLVEPSSVEEIADATTRVLTDGRLRERLVAAGRARLAAFTWERTAERTLETWQRALGRGP
jgi:glycosyltransferase involved in cell wall biosynthesis